MTDHADAQRHEELMRRAIVELREIRSRLESMEQARKEPIAIVGMGCRFPGSVADPLSYWRLLLEGVDTVKEVPPERWNINDYYDPNPETPGKMYSRYGSFLDSVDQFDAEFFGISGREAASMDPQQRLLLEISWEAIENAGMRAADLKDSRTGVYVGVMTQEYSQLSPRLELIDIHTGTGNAPSVIAGRISHFFGLQGPTMVVDTACSSSLVSVHLACQQLRMGECDLALAGGVNLQLIPAPSVAECQARMLSSDGRCRTFDSRADGIGRGEGAALIVLKRLSDALADGDRIIVIIRGSAVNHDGRSSGLTVPNERAQTKLLRAALASAGVEPHEVDYIEAHGTGTPLGDPIEVGALAAVFCQDRPIARPLLIGSVKTNFGHLEGAAGIAALMKAALAVQHGEIPPHLHLEKPNPHIAWSELRVSVPTVRMPWPSYGGQRIADVSSFGLSGTNVHVVLAQAPAFELVKPEAQCPTHILALSAQSETALDELVDRYRRYLSANQDIDLGDLCFTANVGRMHFAHRLAILTTSAAQLEQELGMLGTPPCAAIRRGMVSPERAAETAFLFNGEGTQYAGMARELYQSHPVFRQAVQRCDELLRPLLNRSLIDVLYGDHTAAAGLDDTAIAQPALFAIEYALAEMWRSWGVRPDAVMGCSVGEYVAACVAGVFGLEDGLKLVAARGRLMQSSPAFHSPLVESALAEFFAAASRTRFAEPQLAFVSSLSGRPTMKEVMTPEYWTRHMREPVSFAAGMECVAKLDCSVLLECGPQPILLDRGRQCVDAQRCAWLPTLRPHHPDWQQVTSTLAELYVRGVDVDWGAVYGSPARRRLALPTYPFQRQRYWIGAETTAAFAPSIRPVHPLLQCEVKTAALAEDQRLFESTVRSESPSYLAHHRLYEVPIFPAAAFLEMALAAGRQIFGSDPVSLDEVVIQRPLALHPGTTSTLQLICSAITGSTADFRIFSLNADPADETGPWLPLASGRIQAQTRARATPEAELEEIQSRFPAVGNTADFYAACHTRGLKYGPSFRTLQQLWSRSGEACGQVRLSNSVAAESASYKAHPALLDGCLQVCGVATGAGDILVPVSFERAEVFQSLGTCVWAHAMARSDEQGTSASRVIDLRVYDPGGKLVARLDGVLMHRARRMDGVRDGRTSAGRWLYESAWERQIEQPGGATSDGDTTGSWLIFVDDRGCGKRLAEVLTARGGRCSLVVRGGSFAVKGPDLYSVDPEHEEDYKRLFDVVALNATLPWQAVVHLWSMDGATHDEPDGGNLDTEATLACRSILNVVKVLGRRMPSLSPRLCLVTCGARPWGRGAHGCDLRQAAVWGLQASIALEHPELRCLSIDLDPEDDRQWARHLHQAIGSTRWGDQIVLRAGARYVERLKRLQSLSASGSSRIASEGSYLISGGLGALGLHVARWLVDQGARHLILAGRNEPSPAAGEIIRQLEDSGARPLVMPLDVSRRADLQHLLQSVRKTMPPLRGVVHAAGVLEDGLMLNTDWETFAKVMSPKIGGSWNLHCLTRDDTLDFFVCFSSAAAVLGSVGQAHYAAANAFMDALAHERQRLGLPALSINWGPWAGTGMAAADDGHQLATRYMQPLAPDEALGVLEHLLAGDTPQVAVLPVTPDFRETVLSREGGSPLLRHFASQQPRWDRQRRIEPDGFLKRYRSAPAVERQPLLLAYLNQSIGAVMRRRLSASEANEPLRRMGMDSLMAMEIKSRLEGDLRIEVALARLIEGPSIRELSSLVSEQLDKIVPGDSFEQEHPHMPDLGNLVEGEL